MFRIHCKFRFEYAHRLPNHQGKCRHLHGHSGKATVTICSHSLDKDGFVLDFGEIKQHVKHWIDENWDHQFLAMRDDPLIDACAKQGLRVAILDAPPTAEVMAKYLYDFVQKIIHRDASEAQEIHLESVTIAETCTGSATYYGLSDFNKDRGIEQFCKRDPKPINRNQSDYPAGNR